MLGFQRTTDLHHEHVAQHRDEARHHRGHEQFADRLLGEDGVDDQRDRGRDHDAQRAARCKSSGGQAPGIAVTAQLGQRDLSHGRGRGERRAADRAEAGAGADCGHRHAAAAMTEKRADEAEQAAAQAAMRGELTHQQEQRDDYQVVVREPRVGQILQGIEQREHLSRGEVEIAACADAEHRDADRHTHDQQRHQDAEHAEADADPGHRLPSTRARPPLRLSHIM